MIQKKEELIHAEILFDKHKVSDTSSKIYKDVLSRIWEMIQAGDTIAKIKKYIKSLNLTHAMEGEVTKYVRYQEAIISEGIPKTEIATVLLAGLTLKEIIKNKENSLKTALFRNMTLMIDMHKEEKSAVKHIASTVMKNKKQTVNMYKSYAKGFREYVYAKVEVKYYKDIKGWMSIAILDSSTSSVCVGLHKKFYSVREYKTRLDIPNRPPRHPNCRSILLLIHKDEVMADYKVPNINTFLKENEKIAIDILGKKKHALYIKSKKAIKNFIDLEDGRYFTNEEIANKLKRK